MIHNLNAEVAVYNNILKQCRKLGIDVIEMSPIEHDKHMALSQVYTHLLGRIGEEMRLKSTPLDTKGFTKTLEIQQYVVNDDEQLFLDMFKYNPFSSKIV